MEKGLLVSESCIGKSVLHADRSLCVEFGTMYVFTIVRHLLSPAFQSQVSCCAAYYAHHLGLPMSRLRALWKAPPMLAIFCPGWELCGRHPFVPGHCLSSKIWLVFSLIPHTSQLTILALWWFYDKFHILLLLSQEWYFMDPHWKSVQHILQSCLVKHLYKISSSSCHASPLPQKSPVLDISLPLL